MPADPETTTASLVDQLRETRRMNVPYQLMMDAANEIERLRARQANTDKFLEFLPTVASVVSGGERMKGRSDAELQTWAWGIEDVLRNLEQLIADRKVQP